MELVHLFLPVQMHVLEFIKLYLELQVLQSFIVVPKQFPHALLLQVKQTLSKLEYDPLGHESKQLPSEITVYLVGF